MFFMIFNTCEIIMNNHTCEIIMNNHTCKIIDFISGGKINKPLYFIIKIFNNYIIYISFKLYQPL